VFTKRMKKNGKSNSKVMIGFALLKGLGLQGGKGLFEVTCHWAEGEKSLGGGGGKAGGPTGKRGWGRGRREKGSQKRGSIGERLKIYLLSKVWEEEKRQKGRKEGSLGNKQ